MESGRLCWLLPLWVSTTHPVSFCLQAEGAQARRSVQGHHPQELSETCPLQAHQGCPLGPIHCLSPASLAVNFSCFPETWGFPVGDLSQW